MIALMLDLLLVLLLLALIGFRWVLPLVRRVSALEQQLASVRAMQAAEREAQTMFDQVLIDEVERLRRIMPALKESSRLAPHVDEVIEALPMLRVIARNY